MTNKDRLSKVNKEYKENLLTSLKEETESSAMASHSELPKTDLFQTESKSLKVTPTPNPSKGRKAKLVDDAFVEELKRLNPDRDVDAELSKARTWVLAHPPRQLTQKFFAAWVIRSTSKIKPERFADF